MDIIVTVSVTGKSKIVLNKSKSEVDNLADTFSVADRDSLRTRLQAFVNSFSIKAEDLKTKVKIDDAFFNMVERAVNDNSEKLSVMVRDNLYHYHVFER